MATKKEKLITLIKALDPLVISDEVEYMTIKELEAMYQDKLHVYSAPAPEVPEAPETPEAPEETETPEAPEETEAPPTIGGVTDEDFASLQEKIAGAATPEPKARKKRPIIEKTARKKKKGQSDPESFRVEGYVLLLIVDTAFPFALATLNNMLDKRIKVQANDLQLNDKDFAKLEPLADQAADYMAINLNPIAGFLMISAFMYGNNLLNVRFEAEALEPKK